MKYVLLVSSQISIVHPSVTHTYQAAWGMCQLLGDCEDPNHLPRPPPLQPGSLLQRQVFIRVFWAGSLTGGEKMAGQPWFHLTWFRSRHQGTSFCGTIYPRVAGWIHTDCMVLERLLTESKNREEGT